MGIFEKDKHIDERYSHLDKYVNIMYKGFWLPTKYEKLIKEIDIPHYHNVMPIKDQEAVKRCILAVSMVEDKVKTFWSTLALDLPQTVIGDVGGMFGQSEVTHRRSYHFLTEMLEIDTEDILDHKVIGGRLKYLNKHIEKDPKIIGKKRILKKIILFTSLVERASLFTQFYILMSYAYRNRGLKTISSLQQTTATEENLHYSFGIDVINIIKSEYPQLWEDYLIDLISKNIKEAYKSELNLIDWFFESGVPEHLTREEVVNFLNYNFTKICNDLGLSLKFKYDENMYRDLNEWFTIKTQSPVEPDFFDNAVGGYSSSDESVDLEDIFD